MTQEELKILSNKRHTLSHVLASVILEKYSTVKLTLGPAIDNGFYYDMDFAGDDKPNTEEDWKEITNSMKKKINLDGTFSHRELTKDEALEFFSGNEYKIELINEIAERGEKITLYTINFGDGKTFTDLCRGGHVENLKNIDAESFKITHSAGAYWRGDEKNKMITRIYGLAFNTKQELADYENQMEEAKKRDHRILGEKLDLFCFDENIGKGLPIWLPKGNIIKEELEKWAKETEEKWGYQRVTTPIITKDNLFYTSGHLPLYKESMYAPIKIEEENYYIKPMNCPFHHRAFSARPRTYKELPLRLAEYGWCHRYEDSGSLFGMMRVRGMQMNDAHIYIQKENAVDEFVNVIRLHEYYYKVLGINNYEMELALRDKSNMSKYHGDEQDWIDAENMTKEAMEKSGVPYKIINEGAAFYGPKMDFQVYSSIGRSFTASTNQLDLYMGKAFDLEYVDKDGLRKTPAIIHRAPLGTHERFVGFLIEHFAGAFPLWLSPVQVVLISVKDSSDEYMKNLNQKLKDKNIRTEIFEGKEGMGKSVRYAKEMKYPYWIVIGDKEVVEGKVTLESRSGEKTPLSIDELIDKLEKEVEEKI